MGLTLKSHLESWLWLMRKPGSAFITGDEDGAEELPGKACQSTGECARLGWGSGRGLTALFIGHTSDGEAKHLVAVETPGDQRQLQEYMGY